MFDPVVRIDKNLDFNFLFFQDFSKDDTDLMYMLLIYFAQQRQQDLFGYGILDPITFCKHFNLNLNHIAWTKHKEPRQLKNNKIEDLNKVKQPIYDTVLENALYCLYTNIYEFSESYSFLIKGGKYGNKEKLSSIQFIKELTRVDVPVGKTTKRTYHYVLSQEFINNLSFIFFKINIISFSQSFKKSYQGLYLSLTNKYNEMYSMNTRVQELEFDDLKKTLKIDSENAVYVKRKISKALTDVLNYDDLKDKFSYEWIRKPNHKYKYHIKLTLNVDLVENDINTSKEKLWEEIRFNFLKTSLFDGFIRRYNQLKFDDPLVLKEKYTRWLNRNDIDKEIKETAYFDMCAYFDSKDKKERFLYKNMFDTWYNNLPNEYHKYL